MLHIPPEKLPSEFKDEARLDSLYSPFRSRSVNPRDWEAKISAWKHLISLYCVNNGIYSFNLAQLNKLFIRHGRPPSCLGTVLEELVKNGDLQYLDDYIQDDPKSWAGWATNLLVKKPLSWSYNTMKRSLFSIKSNPDHVYVHAEVIQEESQKLLLSVPGKYRNKIMNFMELLKLIGREVNQSDQVKLLVHHLVKEKKADLKSLKNITNDLESLLVKIGEQDKVPEITEIDISIYVLEQNEKVLCKQVEDMEDEVTQCIKDVKAHLLKNHRQLAKTCLKKKHEIEKRLIHKTNALHNVQILLERVKNVHGDAEVWKAYNGALSAFNSIVSNNGLTEDAVGDTMLKLGEMLDIHDDIQSTISAPVLEQDDDELEEELAELMKEKDVPENIDSDNAEIEEQMAKLDISNLPNVPSTNVSLQEAS